MLTCIPKQDAAKLRQLFGTDGLTIEQLYKMDSAGRRQVFAKALGEETARDANALFEKAMLANQKQAIANWIWKNLYGGTPLYKGLTLNQSDALKNAFTMADLRQMTNDQREKEFDRILKDTKLAKTLARHFADNARSHNLANWEQRVFGTDALRQNKKVKGAFARLELMNDLGVLKPDKLEDFMEDFVAEQMGMTLTAEESAELSKRADAVSKAFDDVGTDWTADNYDAVLGYYKARAALEEYINFLDPESAIEVFADVGARGSILFSGRSLVNSMLYQWYPSLTQAIFKRITTGATLPGDWTVMEKITATLSATTDKQDLKLIWDHVKMGMKIYYETSYDVSRMESLDDGFRYFGERYTHTEGPSLSESKGAKEKIAALMRGHARLMKPGLKWIAGGSDTLIANIQRADTSRLAALITAKAEEKAGTLPQGMTVRDRMVEIFKDSMRPDPQTSEGQHARESGIMDANFSNFTYNNVYAKFAIKMRNFFGIPNKGVGKLFVPFVAIPATALGAGIEMSGPGFFTAAYTLRKAYKMEPGVEKQMELARGITKMLTTSVGLSLAVALMSFVLDDDDYIGPYDFTRRSENALSTTKNARASYVRFGGMWVNTNILGPLGIPLSALMSARQAHTRGRNVPLAYLAGIVNAASQFPGIKEATDWGSSIARSVRANDMKGAAKAMKAQPEDIGKWVAVRTLTSVAVYDLYGFASPDKYDALGRRLPHKRDDAVTAVTSFFIGANIKWDTSNELTEEFDRLNLKNAMPSIANPFGSNVEKLKKKIGEEAYESKLVELKRNYAEKAAALIQTDRYKRASPEKQKEMLDKVRDREIMMPIRRDANRR